VSTPCIAILISTSKNPWSFLLLLILSSIKLEIRAEFFLPGSGGRGGRAGGRGRNDPNIVCTYEKNKNLKKRRWSWNWNKVQLCLTLTKLSRVITYHNSTF
jgi:hypothetical protein